MAKIDKQDFVSLLEDICDVDHGTVDCDVSLNNSILFDSLATLGLIAVLDKKFGRSFSMDDLKKINTVGNLFDQVAAQS